MPLTANDGFGKASCAGKRINVPAAFARETAEPAVLLNVT